MGLSNVRWMPDNAVMQRLAKYAGAVVGAAALSAELAMSAAPAWAQATYSMTTGLPVTADYDSPSTPLTFTRTITVAYEFDINDLTMQINLFLPTIQNIDVYLTDPSGAVTIRVLYYHCGGAPISFCERTYSNNQASPSVTGENDGIPATYTFADGGETIGDDNGSNTPGTVCYEINSNAGRAATNPDWPTWTSAADRPLPDSNWEDNNGDVPDEPWPVAGAYRKLPASRVYEPAQGNFFLNLEDCRPRVNGQSRSICGQTGQHQIQIHGCSRTNGSMPSP